MLLTKRLLEANAGFKYISPGLIYPDKDNLGFRTKRFLLRTANKKAIQNGKNIFLLFETDRFCMVAWLDNRSNQANAVLLNTSFKNKHICGILFCYGRAVPVHKSPIANYALLHKKTKDRRASVLSSVYESQKINLESFWIP